MEDLLESFGNSKELRIAASRALKEKVEPVECNLGQCTEAAYQVAGCGYEYGTNWGVKVSANSRNASKMTDSKSCFLNDLAIKSHIYVL